MALYLGSSEKLKISLSDIICSCNFLFTTPVIEGIQLLTLDDCVLRDVNGLYLTVNGDE